MTQMGGQENCGWYARLSVCVPDCTWWLVCAAGRRAKHEVMWFMSSGSGENGCLILHVYLLTHVPHVLTCAAGVEQGHRVLARCSGVSGQSPLSTPLLRVREGVT